MFILSARKKLELNFLSIVFSLSIWGLCHSSQSRGNSMKIDVNFSVGIETAAAANRSFMFAHVFTWKLNLVMDSSPLAGLNSRFIFSHFPIRKLPHAFRKREIFRFSRTKNPREKIWIRNLHLVPFPLHQSWIYIFMLRLKWFLIFSWDAFVMCQTCCFSLQLHMDLMNTLSLDTWWVSLSCWTNIFVVYRARGSVNLRVLSSMSHTSLERVSKVNNMPCLVSTVSISRKV